MNGGSFESDGDEEICCIQIPKKSKVYSGFDISSSESWGIVEMPSNRLYQGSWKGNRFNNTVVVVDMNSKQLLSVYQIENEKVVNTVGMDGVYIGECNINNSTDIWKGHIQQGVPCGYGKIVSSLGEVKFEGFRFNLNNVCYGKLFHEGSLLYEGMICNDKRHGVAYYSTEKSAQWINDQSWIPKKYIIQPNSSYQINSFLEHLEIETNSVQSTSSLVLSFFQCLQTISIGQKCYSLAEEGICCFSDLPKLQSLMFGQNSFVSTTTVELKGPHPITSSIDLPMLTTLRIGSNCFQSATVLTFSSRLESILLSRSSLSSRSPSLC